MVSAGEEADSGALTVSIPDHSVTVLVLVPVPILPELCQIPPLADTTAWVGVRKFIEKVGKGSTTTL